MTNEITVDNYAVLQFCFTMTTTGHNDADLITRQKGRMQQTTEEEEKKLHQHPDELN